ncbi:MAG: hypothetical protein GHCLOJNM_04444 [bacterium]|nr:hypothetical protein [bacterium]
MLEGDLQVSRLVVLDVHEHIEIGDAGAERQIEDAGNASDQAAAGVRDGDVGEHARPIHVDRRREGEGPAPDKELVFSPHGGETSDLDEDQRIGVRTGPDIEEVVHSAGPLLGETEELPGARAGEHLDPEILLGGQVLERDIQIEGGGIGLGVEQIPVHIACVLDDSADIIPDDQCLGVTRDVVRLHLQPVVHGDIGGFEGDELILAGDIHFVGRSLPLPADPPNRDLQQGGSVRGDGCPGDSGLNDEERVDVIIGGNGRLRTPREEGQEAVRRIPSDGFYPGGKPDSTGRVLNQTVPVRIKERGKDRLIGHRVIIGEPQRGEQQAGLFREVVGLPDIGLGPNGRPAAEEQQRKRERRLGAPEGSPARTQWAASVSDTANQVSFNRSGLSIAGFSEAVFGGAISG